MKRLSTLLMAAAALLAGISLILLLRQRDATADDRPEAAPRTAAAQAAPPAGAVASAARQTPSTADAAEADRQARRAAAFGAPERPRTLADIPASTFRDDLLALSPSGQEKALASFNRLNIPMADVQSLRILNEDGVLHYECRLNCRADGHGHAPRDPAGPASGESAEPVRLDQPEAMASEPPVAPAPVPVASQPVHNSKPGAPFTIYLDFNGAVVSGKQWNTAYGQTSWTLGAYSLDADRTTFNDAEQAQIRQIWQRVAEDYAPYNVNVTTDPAYDAVVDAGNNNTVGWVLITNHGTFGAATDANGLPLPGAAGGGIAYVNVVTSSIYASKYQPAWVHAISLGPNVEQFIAEACSHEFGHNMGLSHDGSTADTDEYYDGHGSGETKWCPIMGSSYSESVTTWSKGEYLSATNLQDDVTIIETSVEFHAGVNNGYRADLHGDTIAAASPLSMLGGTITAPASTAYIGDDANEGIIETDADVDVWSFEAGAGPAVITVDPFVAEVVTYGRGHNLDIKLTLYDSGGTPVVTADPALTLDATISTTLAAGTYFLKVEGVGVGTPFSDPPTGYTSYGSIGQYFISGSVTVGTGVLVSESDGSTTATEGGQGDSYTVVLATQPTVNVTVTVSPDSQLGVAPSSLVFSPATWSSPQTVTVTAVDDAVLEGPHSGSISHTAGSADGNYNGLPVGSVSVSITDNDNLAPVAVNDSAVLDEDAPATTLPVLTNDYDPNAGQPFSITGVTQAANGTVGIAGGGTALTYQPDPDFNGSDSFTYTITDSFGLTATATVEVTVNPVNDTPVAAAQSVTTSQNSPLKISLSGSDADGDSLAFTLAAAPAHGTLYGTAPVLVYLPAPGYSGSDSFTFTANDGTATSAAATISITVQAAVSVNINFGGPATGFLADTGGVYAARNSQTYGWTKDASADAFNRNNPSSPSEEFDTGIIMNSPGSGVTPWRLAVPNGTYQLTLAAGDPNSYATYSINAEGVNVLSGTTSGSTYWIQSSGSISINDGQLTIENGPSATNKKNAIAFLRLTNVANKAPVVELGADLSVNSGLTLDAIALDDGLPGTGLTCTWSEPSGLGVSFGTPAAEDTTVAFTGGPGTYTLRLTVNDGQLAAFDEVAVTYTLTALQQWRLDFFGSSENTGTAADDHDYLGDGMINILKFALGGNPDTPASQLAPVKEEVQIGADTFLQMAFRRRIGAGSGSIEDGYTVDGVTYTVETSLDLVDPWSTGAAVLEAVGAPVDNGDGTETVTVRIKAPLNSTAPAFIRLKVQGPAI